MELLMRLKIASIFAKFNRAKIHLIFFVIASSRSLRLLKKRHYVSITCQYEYLYKRKRIRVIHEFVVFIKIYSRTDFDFKLI